MAGPVTPPCHAIRVELTELLMLDRPLPMPLARHLAWCADCSAEMAEVRRVIRTFERAEPPLDGSASGSGPGAASGSGSGSGLPPARRRGDWLVSDREGDEPSGEVPADGRPEPSAVPEVRPKVLAKRRRAAAVVAGVVLAACAVLATVVTGDEQREPAAADVTMTRKDPMIERSWGTEVPVSLSGLEPGETYRLMTGDARGKRQSAGSVRAGDGDAPMRTRMVTAMPRAAITTLIVQDESGRTVARLPVTSPASRTVPTQSPPVADG